MSGFTIISEAEFAVRIRERLADAPSDIGWVTGPGRSGAVAAVYASHLLSVPFIPYKNPIPDQRLGRLLLIDTAIYRGRTIRKALAHYRDLLDLEPHVVTCYEEPPRVVFWYEGPKPERFKHERPPPSTAQSNNAYFDALVKTKFLEPSR